MVGTDMAEALRNLKEARESSDAISMDLALAALDVFVPTDDPIDRAQAYLANGNDGAAKVVIAGITGKKPVLDRDQLTLGAIEDLQALVGEQGVDEIQSSNVSMRVLPYVIEALFKEQYGVTLDDAKVLRLDDFETPIVPIEDEEEEADPTSTE